MEQLVDVSAQADDVYLAILFVQLGEFGFQQILCCRIYLVVKHSQSSDLVGSCLENVAMLGKCNLGASAAHIDISPDAALSLVDQSTATQEFGFLLSVDNLDIYLCILYNALYYRFTVLCLSDG